MVRRVNPYIKSNYDPVYNLMKHIKMLYQEYISTIKNIKQKQYHMKQQS